MVSDLKTAWVVGASSGIGRHLALALAGSGCTVAVTARREHALRELADSAPPGRIRVFPCDITDEAAVRRTHKQIDTQLGPLDRCFLNAGDYEPTSLTEIDTALFRRIIGVNIMGITHCLATILPSMTARGSGEIYITASVAGYRGLPMAGPYGMTKAALINLAETLHAELKPLGINVRLINPGFVTTPMTDKNTFSMPFVISPERAAGYIMRALDSGNFEITFPKRFTWMLKVLRILPYRLYFPLVKRLKT